MMININLKILDDKLHGYPKDKPLYPLLKSRVNISFPLCFAYVAKNRVGFPASMVAQW